MHTQLRHSLLIVLADWDDQGKLWAASCDDIPALATKARTLEELRDRVLAAIGDIAQQNGIEAGLPEISVYITAGQTTRIPNPHWRV